MNDNDSEQYDVVVVGGGAAGLSAALVLSRARRRVAVVDAGAPRNAPAAHMQGYLSRDGMPPRDLLAVGRAEVQGYGGQLIAGTVAGVDRNGGPGLRVLLSNGPQLTARRLIVATGLRDELPDVPGVRERWGRDLLHCPYCHGYEVRDQQLGVLGGTPDAVQHALLVRQWSPDVIYFPHTDTLTANDREQLDARGIGIVEGNVRRLVVDDDHLRGIELDPGDIVHRAAVFVRRDSSRTPTCWPAWDARSTPTAGSRSIPPGAPACRTCGSPGTRRIPGPRSSPPPARDPRSPSRSTQTSSERTFSRR